ncbi:hypothetical protein DICSQDRAFT_138861 [Dichomitus squalens LYAD-421 SS1]|uniref:Uncharacterized protein n=2 Tax=Dichomitus squalens TaxID=114155 RepID=A0A4V2JZ85_9APHY|nr:uncharacterized protein DICSQDRAFT_138861 [Dichomitus squalens LYAD-421 SS1]EJF58965.1 hypothetical protein DICSQDRAFT_138861 [Dichomitus squalens LYAD-421 SS1]TBU24093.1 hypothetical protein BD311DRAFT_730145 [Dichomitus squalens]
MPEALNNVDWSWLVPSGGELKALSGKSIGFHKSLSFIIRYLQARRYGMRTACR